MNQLFRNEFTEPAEEMKKLIANIKNNLDLYESADKFVKVVEKNNMPKITMLTAYDYPFAKIVDEAGCKE